MSEANQGASVSLRNLTKVFPGVATPAVDRASLDIAPGEFMTLLGPSGSGKTTTLNMIAGFTKATSGEILVNEKNVVALPAHKRNMGMVFQQYALFPHMTATENISFPLEQRKISKTDIKQKVKDALALVHLEDYGHRYPKQMSGGQQQRVAVARALVFSPQVLLMDEPLGALDKRLRERLQVELARIHRNLGLTFIFVTHDQEEALSLSNRIAVFNEGKIEQVGSSTELYERPKTLFVAGFLGDSTVLPGQVSSGMVNVKGQTFATSNTSTFAERDQVGVVIRPERISIHEQAPVDSNSVSALVTDIVYLGSSRKLVCEVFDGIPAIVSETAAELTNVRPGDTVFLSWKGEDSVAVPATEFDILKAVGVDSEFK